jgi:hypothetical protein
VNAVTVSDCYMQLGIAVVGVLLWTVGSVDMNRT